MTERKNDQPDKALIAVRSFAGRKLESEEALSALSDEAKAALRQFSLERMTGYGIDYADAVELRGRVVDGQDWQSAARALADICVGHAEKAPEPAGRLTRGAYLRRASALLRMSQMMLLTDTDERRAIFKQAAALYEQAAELLNDRRRVTLETEQGKVAGWLISAGESAVASSIVIGGIEGWAMDFDSLGEALAARGVDTLMLDGPGQGETRLVHRHHLTAQWPRAYSAAIDFLEQRAPGRPIGFVGNSMGGTFAMAVTVADPRIAACCNNGGVIAPRLAPQAGTFFSKMVAFCGVPPEQALEVWATVTPVKEGPNAGYPLLMVQGGKDPMVTMEMSEMLMQRAPTEDKQMIVFSDGDHCVYNHKSDRDVLIADWMRARLGGLVRHESSSN